MPEDEDENNESDEGEIIDELDENNSEVLEGIMDEQFIPHQELMSKDEINPVLEERPQNLEGQVRSFRGIQGIQGNQDEEKDEPGIYDLDRSNPNEPTGSINNMNYDLNSGSLYDTTNNQSNLSNNDTNNFTGFPQDSSSNLGQSTNFGQTGSIGQDSYKIESDRKRDEDKKRGFF